MMETREKLTVERTRLHIKMGIRQLDNQRTLDHKEFISMAKELIKDVQELKTELQHTLQTQEGKSKQIIEETHIAYESGFVVLQETAKGLRQSLTAKKSVDEILSLKKEIYQQLFNPEISTNQMVCAQMKT